MKSFKQRLRSKEKRIGPIGDLARDVRWDYEDHKPIEEPLPGRLTANTLRAYLGNRNACDGALRALDEAASEYASNRTSGR